MTINPNVGQERRKNQPAINKNVRLKSGYPNVGLYRNNVGPNVRGKKDNRSTRMSGGGDRDATINPNVGK
jgi:hypothetical protein